jgi:hypothetical protein
MIQKLALIVLLVLVASSAAFGQSTGTINGRVSDATGAVVPGAAVAATNPGTGATRSTMTNSDGLYNIPTLQPGVYDIKVEMAGFVPLVKKQVTLITDTSLAEDFSLTVAGTTQQVEVSGEAVMVDTTQSVVSGSLRTTEVQDLPMLNRNFTGLVTLVPGARPAAVLNPTKVTMGPAISVGGGIGRNVEVNVDGMDNKDDLLGGPVQNYTIEGMQEFKLLSHEYGSQYGRTNGAVLQIVSKSGTNSLHGTAFGYGRNDAMTAIDYFTKQNGLPKTAYSREQFGGSLGGPIKKNRWFFFGAYERIQQYFVDTVAPTAYNEAVSLVPILQQIGYTVVPAATIPSPYRDNLYTLKTDFQISSHHSLFVRWGQQINSAHDDQQIFKPLQADLSTHMTDVTKSWSLVAGETWIIGNRSVNQFLFQSNDYFTNISRDGDNCSVGFYCTSPGQSGFLPPTTILSFPAVQIGGRPGGDQIFIQKKEQFQDNFSRQMGDHSLKFGGDFSFYPKISIITNIGLCGGLSFFDNPSTIINNTNQKYPQGFQTPGIVSSIGQGNCLAPDPSTLGQKQFGAYVQDDWRVTPRLTLNLGLRYDVDINWYDQSQLPINRDYLVLQAIGSPYGQFPHNSPHNFGPRFGFAWDIRGNAKDVLRAGFGLFFDENLGGNAWTITRNSLPVLGLANSFVNTSVKMGQEAGYVFGVSPLPAAPPVSPTQLPAGGNTSGALYDPGITNPYNEQFHAGYARQLSVNMTLSADYIHVLGLREFRGLQINPLEGAWDPNAVSYNTCGIPAGTSFRRLQCAFKSALGDPKILGPITLVSSPNRSQYNEFIVHFERRSGRATFQASYTLSSAYGFGGGVSGIVTAAGSVAGPQNQDLPFGPGEWGPTATDERHRVVISGVFNLPLGIQVSPIFQAASARPYTLTAGSDCNADGTNNDRAFINSTTGAVFAGCPAPGATGFAEAAVNSQRGTATWDLDTRVTKFFTLGKEDRKLGLFAEFYNITNKANFGNNYNGNARSGTAFEQPNAYVAGLPTSRQMQLGARFLF